MSFPRYPSYKPSGVDWLGDVPSHWRVSPLKRRLRLVNDKATRRTFPVALENIEGSTGRYLATETEFEGEGVAFRNGDVLFGKLRPYLAKVLLAEQDGEAVGDLFVLRPITGVSGRFAARQILNRPFIDVVDGTTFGSKMPRVSWEALGSMPFAVPPSEEQSAIVSFLDRETAKIDALVAEQERLIELLKEKRQAVISHAVTKGLNPDAPLRPSGVEWLGEVPAHWEVTKMKWVAAMDSGHTPDKKVPEYWENGDIPWVSLNDTAYLKDNDYISDTAFCVTALGIANSSAHLLPTRAVVFSRDATIGRCAIIGRPMAVSQHFIAWICGDRLVPEFLLLRLRSMAFELERLTTGATVKTIGMPEVRSLITPVPPKNEQLAIVEHVTTATSGIDALKANAQMAIALLLERRSTLVATAITGQIDVRGAAPSEST